MNSDEREAYENGERPRSKFSKKELYEAIGGAYGIYAKALAQKHSAKFLREKFLKHTSDRYLGKFCTLTPFWSIDMSKPLDEAIELLKLDEAEEERKAEEAAAEKLAEPVKNRPWHPCIASWTEYEGGKYSQNHVLYVMFGKTDLTRFYGYDKPHGEFRKERNWKQFTCTLLDEDEARKRYADIFGNSSPEAYDNWLEAGARY